MNKEQIQIAQKTIAQIVLNKIENEDLSLEDLNLAGVILWNVQESLEEERKVIKAK